MPNNDALDEARGIIQRRLAELEDEAKPNGPPAVPAAAPPPVTPRKRVAAVAPAGAANGVAAPARIRRSS